MPGWNDVLVEAASLRATLEDSIRLCRAEHPQSEFTKLNLKNLEAALVSCEEIILSVNERIGARHG